LVGLLGVCRERAIRAFVLVCVRLTENQAVVGTRDFSDRQTGEAADAIRL
jgi:hypothetical protein